MEIKKKKDQWTLRPIIPYCAWLIWFYFDQVGPRFAEQGSFEAEYGEKWKQLYEMKKQVRNIKLFWIPITFNNPLKACFLNKKHLIRITPEKIVMVYFLLKNWVLTAFKYYWCTKSIT